ncbi:MAG: hypothetical protein WC750_04995 [Patescibacteria group bacterium]|jgi:hypothetical protein
MAIRSDLTLDDLYDEESEERLDQLIADKNQAAIELLSQWEAEGDGQDTDAGVTERQRQLVDKFLRAHNLDEETIKERRAGAIETHDWYLRTGNEDWPGVLFDRPLADDKSKGTDAEERLTRIEALMKARCLDEASVARQRVSVLHRECSITEASAKSILDATFKKQTTDNAALAESETKTDLDGSSTPLES